MRTSAGPWTLLVLVCLASGCLASSEMLRAIGGPHTRLCHKYIDHDCCPKGSSVSVRLALAASSKNAVQCIQDIIEQVTRESLVFPASCCALPMFEKACKMKPAGETNDSTSKPDENEEDEGDEDEGGGGGGDKEEEEEEEKLGS